MRVVLLLSLLTALTLGQQLDKELEEIWQQWKQKYNKVYSTSEEEIKRRTSFMKRVAKIQQHNLRHDLGLEGYTMGLNEFCDREWEEIKAVMFPKTLGNNPLWNDKEEVEFSNKPLPSKWDWRDHGGHCGSCWAFSACGAIEGQLTKKHKKLTSLSEQQLVDCSGDYGNLGCNGGLMDLAFLYAEKYGIESEKDYKYKGVENKCHHRKWKSVVKVKKFVDLPSGNEKQLQRALYEYGPISIAIDATDDLLMYSSGVYESRECSQTAVNHGVLLVGYGTEHGKDYWLIKNSWSARWGSKGYFKLRRNKRNMCGVASNASYPIL
ncbi:unnamed protein product [Trichobilharzia regenti]|nr:unnamed protein product [Trichobilharzia regenti]